MHNNIQTDRKRNIVFKSTCEILRLMTSGWLVLVACMSGAPYVKATLDGGYTAQLTEELGIPYSGKFLMVQIFA